MSIKEYVKSNSQEDWIDYIVEALSGTTNLLDEYQDEYRKEGFNEDDLLAAIDTNIWNCETCGWWVDVGETDEEGNCEDCQE